jgi:hypothetical protein
MGRRQCVAGALAAGVAASGGACALLVGDVDGTANFGGVDASASDVGRDRTERSPVLDGGDAGRPRTDGPSHADVSVDHAPRRDAPVLVDAKTDATHDAGSRYAAAVLADHPIAYWRLGEPPSSTVALDESGGAHSGLYTASTKAGVPGLLTDDPNTAAQFNGVNSAVNLGSMSDFDFSGRTAFSLEAWIKPASNIDTASSYPRIFDRESGNGTLTWGYGFWLVNLTPSFARFDQSGDAEVSEGVTAQSFPATVGGVSYVVATYDGTTDSIYVDGVLANTNPDTLSISSYANTAFIGGEVGTTVSYYPFGGTIDEVAVYNFALSGQQVMAHYEAGTAQ